MSAAPPATFQLTSIGVIRTPFEERVAAPRQATAARDIEGTIELYSGRDFEHALSDLDGWEYLWLVYAFHLNTTWRPKVLPPRSDTKRGVFSTRSPHRPNPIGLSAVRLIDVRGLTIRVRGVDMVDGTPLLDLKPYVPYCDSVPNAKTGWLEGISQSRGPNTDPNAEAPPDPISAYAITYAPHAEAELAWLADHGRPDVREGIERVLSLGPQPHPYRRIRRDAEGLLLAVKDWRVRFESNGTHITVVRIASGYRERELVTSDEPAVALQREFREAAARIRGGAGT